MGKKSFWYEVVCGCGAAFLVTQARLDAGRGKYCSKTCGNRATSTKHGHTKKIGSSPTYQSWMNMRQRCMNPKKPKFHEYGAVGITIDPRWNSFEAFLADMGERPQGTTIDRWPDKDGNYGPQNCRWATPQEQSENTRMTTFVSYRGQSISMSQLARVTGINKRTLQYRIKSGWLEDDWIKPADRSHRVSQTG